MNYKMLLNVIAVIVCLL